LAWLVIPCLPRETAHPANYDAQNCPDFFDLETMPYTDTGS
ncbi:MAG: hypothetical protein QOD50_513, partial [Actinomycetota bacterium]|nr:hypothetical protein [Actinomycetota bacterium]